jgi:hypothetical protein
MGLTFDAFHFSNKPAITIRTTEIIYTVITSLIKKGGMRGRVAVFISGGLA